MRAALNLAYKNLRRFYQSFVQFVHNVVSSKHDVVVS